MFLLFLILSAGSFFGSAVCRLRYEETLPLTCTGIVAILYIAGLTGHLAAGVQMTMLLMLLLIASSCLFLVLKKDLRSFCKRFFSFGFFFFAAMFLFLTLFHFGRVASAWDEFSHWMDIVKVMVTLDDFGTNPLSVSLFQSYPPGLSLFQYFAHKVFSFSTQSSDFVEWIVFVAFHLYTFAFVLPFLCEAKIRKPWPVLFFVIAVCLGPMVFFENFLCCIYADPFISVAAGSGLAMLYLHRQKTPYVYFYECSVILSLVLAKDAGMMFAVFIAAALLLNELFSFRSTVSVSSCSSQFHKLLLVCMGIFVSLVLPKLLWEHHLVITQATQQFSAPIDFAKLFNVLIGRDDSYQKTVLLNYLRTILVDGFELLNGSLFLTLPVLCLLLLAGLLGIHQAHCRLDSSAQKRQTATIWIAAVQTVTYILGLCIVYMFKFSEDEAVRLASFQRYCSIALTAVLIFLSLLVFSYIARRTVNWVCVLLIAMAFSLIPGANLLSFINRSSIQNALNIQSPYKESASETLAITGTDSHKIYIVSQRSNGFDYYMLKFNLRPCMANQGYWSLSPNGELYENDIWTKKLSAEDWKERRKDFDYVFLYQIDDTFVLHYSVLFENPNDISDQTVFKVDHETGLLTLCS